MLLLLASEMMFGMILRLIRHGVYIPFYERFEGFRPVLADSLTVPTHAMLARFAHDHQVHILAELSDNRILQFGELHGLFLHRHIHGEDYMQLHLIELLNVNVNQ